MERDYSTSTLAGNRLVLPEKALNIWEIASLTPEMSEVFMQCTDPGAAWNFWEVAQRSQAQIREQVRGERHWIYLIILTIVLLVKTEDLGPPFVRITFRL